MITYPQSSFNESFLLQVMMEYILIADVNSSDRCAHQLGTLLANCKALVMLNIIPYNPTASWQKTWRLRDSKKMWDI